MELIAAALLAFPIGYFARSSRSGLLIYLGVAADDQVDASYWPVNVVILTAGIALNRYGRHRRERTAAAIA